MTAPITKGRQRGASWGGGRAGRQEKCRILTVGQSREGVEGGLIG